MSALMLVEGLVHPARLFRYEVHRVRGSSKPCVQEAMRRGTSVSQVLGSPRRMQLRILPLAMPVADVLRYEGQRRIVTGLVAVFARARR